LGKFLSVFLFSFVSISSASVAPSWDGKIFDVKSLKPISRNLLLGQIRNSELIIFGEKHYTPLVQLAEAELIRDSVAVEDQRYPFSLGWEFLAYTQAEINHALFRKVEKGELTVSEFLLKTQGIDQSRVYAPVIQAVKDFSGNLYGLNLTREEKGPIKNGGLKSIDPKYVPPGFGYPSSNYFERFADVMRDHVPADKLQFYYDAQALTDDVMADQLLKAQKETRRMVFGIMGSFHSAFFDGTINRIKNRSPQTKLLSIMIVDASDYSESELENDLSEILIHPRYGELADTVVFVNEPKPSDLELNFFSQSRAVFRTEISE
jgi:uncharacterized iron-regulated protein